MSSEPELFSTDENDITFTINKEALEKFRIAAAKAFGATLVKRVQGDVIPSLGPKNFEGEAMERLTALNLPLTKLAIQEQCDLLFSEFTKNSENTVVYNEGTNLLEVNKHVVEGEYGSLFWPASKTLSRTAEDLSQQG